jgi:hypothetical protein
VSEKSAKGESVFAKTWVHVFEEDDAEGAVYRAEDDATIPLSRRPRTRLELRPDGSAHISVPGADDRGVKQPAAWTEENGSLVVREPGKAKRLRVVSHSPARLVVRTETEGDSK